MIKIDDRDKPDPGKAAVTSRPARDSVRGSRDGRDGAGGIAVRDFPAGPEPGISRPGTAPAYYWAALRACGSPSCVRAAGAPQPITRCKLLGGLPQMADS
jgi:hypothetical protein